MGIRRITIRHAISDLRPEMSWTPFLQRGLAKQRGGFEVRMVEAAEKRGAEALFVASPEEAGEWLVANVREGDVVLLKASRGVRLEKALTVVAAGSQ